MESQEVALARLQEQMKTVIDGQHIAKESREKADDKLESISELILKMDRRVEKVEIQLASNAPTIEEFITIKHQVTGAGRAGKFLWAAGGIIIASAFYLREAIRNWLLGGGAS